MLVRTCFCKVENLLVPPSLLRRCPPPTWLPPVVVTALFMMSLIGRGKGAPGLLGMRDGLERFQQVLSVSHHLVGMHEYWLQQLNARNMPSLARVFIYLFIYESYTSRGRRPMTESRKSTSSCPLPPLFSSFPRPDMLARPSGASQSGHLARTIFEKFCKEKE